MAVVDGVVYAVQDGRRPTLVAFDVAAASTRWETAVTPGSDAGVTVEDGTVYVVGGAWHTPRCVPVSPTLAAVDAADGETRWEYEPDAPFSVQSPALTDGALVFGGDGLTVLASDAPGRGGRGRRRSACRHCVRGPGSTPTGSVVQRLISHFRRPYDRASGEITHFEGWRPRAERATGPGQFSTRTA